MAGRELTAKQADRKKCENDSNDGVELSAVSVRDQPPADLPGFLLFGLCTAHRRHSTIYVEFRLMRPLLPDFLKSVKDGPTLVFGASGCCFVCSLGFK